MQTKQAPPYLGFGLGLRPEHYNEILSQAFAIDWFEILTENYFVQGGKPLYYLDQICERYPVVMHGVSLSIGSVDTIDDNYLKQVKQLAKRVNPAWISDHLCWTGVNSLNMHDLLPLPYTEEAIQHVVARINHVQDYLEQPILIENVSSYLTYKTAEMTEWEFLSAIVEQANCRILLDVNNVYVSSVNHQFNPIEYINNIPLNRVYQIHLAGHSQQGHYIIDTHDAPIVQDVWDLFYEVAKLLGPISTMIERDDHIPPLDELVKELNIARDITALAIKEKAVA